MSSMADAEAKFPPNPRLKTQNLFLRTQICLRVLAVATTMAASCVMLSNKQSIKFGTFTLEARYSYSSAFRFFVIANLVACAFTLLSLLFLLIVGRRSSNPVHYFLLFLQDLLMTCLVLAGCSAASAIGLLGKHGNTHTGWIAVCGNFGKFCNRGTTSVTLSYLGLTSLLMLTVLSASKSWQIQV